MACTQSSHGEVCKECTDLLDARSVGWVWPKAKKIQQLWREQLEESVSIPARALRQNKRMKSTIEILMALQELIDRGSKPATNEQAAEILQLRLKLPGPVLAYFDRRVARGCKGIAEVRHGVCTSCHLRVAVGTVASLAGSPHLVSCENCGSYLIPAPEMDFAGREGVGQTRVTVRRSVTRKVPPTAIATAGTGPETVVPTLVSA